MRLVVVGALLLVVGVGALIVGGSSRPNRGKTVQAPVEPAPPTDPYGVYGAPLGGGDYPGSGSDVGCERSRSGVVTSCDTHQHDGRRDSDEAVNFTGGRSERSGGGDNPG